MNDYSLELKSDYSIGRFTAMACPCEILVDSTDRPLIDKLISTAFNEARRIEKKFSRYRDDNIVYEINHTNGKPLQVDNETADLLDFAEQCYQLSEGMFDITSGILRNAWTFDGSDKLPDEQLVQDNLKRVGWRKVNWQRPELTLQTEMEIDLGGIGKEYAVDKTASQLLEITDTSFLVNYGGDLFCPHPRKNNKVWHIGVENPEHTTRETAGSIAFLQGGLATSGDARRYLLKDGVRYSHILNPKTGWPVADAPRSVSVSASTCIEAGVLATFALLQGKNAEAFLKSQNVKYWIIK